MLAPETAAAARHGLDARLLIEASQLDPCELNAWLDGMPSDQYTAALRVHAHLLTTRSTVTVGATR